MCVCVLRGGQRLENCCLCVYLLVRVYRLIGMIRVDESFGEEIDQLNVVEEMKERLRVCIDDLWIPCRA